MLVRAWMVTAIATVLLVAALAIAPIWDGAIFARALQDTLSRDPETGQSVGDDPAERGMRAESSSQPAMPTAPHDAGQVGPSRPSSAAALAQKFNITPLAEKRVTQLPPGPWFWRIDNFPTLAEAEAAAGPTALAAEIAGKAWLFTLGPPGRSSPGGSKVAEVGPISSISAPEYLLRINSAGGPPGVHTRVHTHPGSETFYVLTGELTQKTPEGTHSVSAGHSMPGHPPGTPMEVSSSGDSDLTALVMFVVDATKPFSSPATMP